MAEAVRSEQWLQARGRAVGASEGQAAEHEGGRCGDEPAVCPFLVPLCRGLLVGITHSSVPWLLLGLGMSNSR